MRVLLIRPPARHTVESEVPEAVEAENLSYPPLALLSIAQFLLENSDHEVKILDAQLTCSVPAGVSVAATVPTNARATVRIPFPAATNTMNITISESGTPVFQGGAFVNGAAGVLGASVGVNDLPVGVVTVDIEVASGSFSFTSS
jgi:hypothetical protein